MYFADRRPRHAVGPLPRHLRRRASRPSPVAPMSDPAAAKRASGGTSSRRSTASRPAAVEAAWPYLGSPDRFLRYAARVAVEFQPVESWQDQALAEKRPDGADQRRDRRGPRHTKVTKTAPSTTEPSEYEVLDPTLQAKVIESLNRLNLKSLSEEQLLDARAYGLAFIRLGKPDDGDRQGRRGEVRPVLPGGQPRSSTARSAQLLVYLQSPASSTTRDGPARPSRQPRRISSTTPDPPQPAHAPAGRIDQRKAYFSFINHAMAELQGRRPASRSSSAASARTPEDAQRRRARAARPGPQGRHADRRRQADASPAAVRPQLARCPTWSGEVEQATHGPELRQRPGRRSSGPVRRLPPLRRRRRRDRPGPARAVGNRFSPADVLESIILPSKVISRPVPDDRDRHDRRRQPTSAASPRRTTTRSCSRPTPSRPTRWKSRRRTSRPAGSPRSRMMPAGPGRQLHQGRDPRPDRLPALGGRREGQGVREVGPADVR